jgi:hypothetical protein
LDLVKTGSRTGRIIHENQSLPKLPDPSLINVSNLRQYRADLGAVFWMRERHARLVGESLALVNSEKKLLLEGVGGEDFCKNDQANNYLLLPEPIELSGSWTSIVSRWSGGFYHWLMDELPRLALLGEFPSKTGILVRGSEEPYKRKSLQMLGVMERVRETREHHLLVEDYYFSSPVGATGCVNPHAVKWLRGMFLSHAAAGPSPDHFFVKRTGKTRGIKNQQELAEYFLSIGWSVIDLEQLSFSEQIGWFGNARAIIAEHGAGLTNLVWCQPGCQVLELCADNFLNGCYEGIAICCGLHHEFRIFSADKLSLMNVELDEIKLWIRQLRLG